MATTTNNDVQTARGTRRLTTETRPATKTTELMAYIGAVLAVAIAALVFVVLRLLLGRRRA